MKKDYAENHLEPLGGCLNEVEDFGSPEIRAYRAYRPYIDTLNVCEDESLSGAQLIPSDDPLHLVWGGLQSS